MYKWKERRVSSEKARGHKQLIDVPLIEMFSPLRKVFICKINNFSVFQLTDYQVIK